MASFVGFVDENRFYVRGFKEGRNTTFEAYVVKAPTFSDERYRDILVQNLDALRTHQNGDKLELHEVVNEPGVFIVVSDRVH